VEVRIGIKENGRDISFESDQDAKALTALVDEALSGSMLKLTDNKGQVDLGSILAVSPTSRSVPKRVEG
jgi:hypothetical protein